MASIIVIPVIISIFTIIVAVIIAIIVTITIVTQTTQRSTGTGTESSGGCVKETTRLHRATGAPCLWCKVRLTGSNRTWQARQVTYLPWSRLGEAWSSEVQ